MASNTRIVTEIDLDRMGRQVGVLRIPYSHNISAWGAILVPMAVFHHGSGPTMLFVSGAHGDEYEGPLTLGRLIRELDVRQVEGRVIVVPGMNQLALQQALRISPADGRDLNRSFPGARDGTPTQILAHYIAEILVPLADIVVDYHSGGRSLRFVPSIIMHELGDTARQEKTFGALQEFGAPYGMVLRELDSAGTLDEWVESRGKLFLTTELAGGANVTPAAMKVAWEGTWNLLRHFGVVAADTGSQARAKTDRLVRVPEPSYYVIAPQDGIWEPCVELGAQVACGQVVGRLHSLQEVERVPVELRSVHEGFVVAERAPAQTSAGDCLAVVGEVLHPG